MAREDNYKGNYSLKPHQRRQIVEMVKRAEEKRGHVTDVELRGIARLVNCAKRRPADIAIELGVEIKAVAKGKAKGDSKARPCERKVEAKGAGDAPAHTQEERLIEELRKARENETRLHMKLQRSSMDKVKLEGRVRDLEQMIETLEQTKRQLEHELEIAGEEKAGESVKPRPRSRPEAEVVTTLFDRGAVIQLLATGFRERDKLIDELRDEVARWKGGVKIIPKDEAVMPQVRLEYEPQEPQETGYRPRRNVHANDGMNGMEVIEIG